jgi:hypothetical protein
MCAVAVAGWQMLAQLDAGRSDRPALGERKSVTVPFFLQRIVPEARGLRASATGGSELLYALDREKLLA